MLAQNTSKDSLLRNDKAERTVSDAVHAATQGEHAGGVLGMPDFCL